MIARKPVVRGFFSSLAYGLGNMAIHELNLKSPVVAAHPHKLV
jgi:hypothetical protein